MGAAQSIAGGRESTPAGGVADDDGDDRTGEAAMTKCTRCGEELVAQEEICPRCGAIVGTLKTPLVIDGRYSVERTLGAGSMGVVHLARDMKLGRRVAIKMIAPEMATEPLATGRFAREAATLAAIRSEHVVRVYAFGKHGHAHFFVMEYVHGRDVDDMITAHANHGKYVPTHRALTILRQVARGLAAVHAAGIVHRDVKPGNIVIEEETGRPVLVDFGLARSIERAQSARSTVGAGTPWYMAPEQADDDDEAFVISPRTDVYALACTAFELLTARPPFDSTDPDELMHQHLHETPPLVSAIRPEIKRFDDVIARALSKTPSRRYDSAEAFVAALDAMAREDEVETPAPVSVSTPEVGRRPMVRALVVTDDDLFLQSAARAVQRAFDGAPITVTSASSMLEASTIAQWNPPQLVLVDDDAQGLDGVVTLSRFRSTAYGSQVRAIVASERVAAGSDDERWRYEVVGVRTFVRKPAEHDELVAVIADVAKRAGWR